MLNVLDHSPDSVRFICLVYLPLGDLSALSALKACHVMCSTGYLPQLTPDTGLFASSLPFYDLDTFISPILAPNLESLSRLVLPIH